MFTLLRAFFTHAVKYVRRAIGASAECNGSIKSFRLPALAFLSLVLAGPALADFTASGFVGNGTPVKVPFCANVDYGLAPNAENPDVTATKYCVPLAAGSNAYEYGWSEASAVYGWPGVSFPCGNASCKTGNADYGVGTGWVSCPANASLIVGADQCHCNSGYTDNPQTHNSCSALVVTDEALAPQSCTTCVGNPIFPFTGVKREPVHTGIVIGGVELVLLYDSSTGQRPPLEGNATALSEAPAFGALWKSNFHQKLQIAVGATRALLSLGNGQVLTFTGDGAGNYSAYGYNKDKLTTISGGWRLARTDGTIETFDSNGNLATLVRPEGEVLSFSYSGAQLQSVQSSEGRTLQFVYTGNLVTSIRGPDGRATAAAYDANGNLSSLTWPDNHTRTFLYENTALPWALTGVVDENNSRYSTFTYDTSGHVLSTEHSGGVDRYSVSYGASAPVWLIADTFDSARNTVYRKHSWQPPSGTALTRPNGESVSLDAQAVIGVPSVTSQSQAAGSGSQPASTSTSYDSSGNVASRVDATGVRTCYTYDSNNREVARFEAATVTCDQATAANSRLITTNWHPDWKLPTVITEPLKKTTIVYHGQPDPFNANATASCTSAPNRADGKPVPLVCKQVEQALLANGSVDANTSTRTTSATYDSAGRVLTSTDARNKTTTYAYYTSESFSGNPPGTYDPDYDSVSVLLHGNGANGSTTFTDNSPWPSTVTGAGNAQISTAQSQFGGASMAFDGSGDYLSIANSAALDLTSDFTIELWVNPNVTMNSTTGQKVFVGKWAGSGNASWMIDYYQGAVHGYLYTTGNITLTTTATRTLTAGTWNHIAYTRAGSNFYLFVNGSLLGTSNSSATQRTTAVPALVGYKGDGSGTEYLNGYIDDLRITKGKARYTAGFSVPSVQFADHGIVVSPSDVGHAIGDLQSVTNAAGQVTQYTLYDPAGRVRQLIDPKGITTDISYTPRGWVSTVSVTPPGGSARTTSYTHDGVGQMAGVALPDGTSLAYSYDAAHRLTGVTDTQGNSVTYTLDAAGNRTGEDLRDATGALRRSIGRSFDALNRLQQVTGAAQ